MGLRFRKSISLGRFLRLNLSKSGVSVGVGPPGLNVNLGPRGIRQTVGLPGTGLYYQETSRWPKPADVAPATEAPTRGSGGTGFGYVETSQWPKGADVAPAIEARPAGSSGVDWKAIGVALAIFGAIAIATYFHGGSPTKSKGTSIGHLELDAPPTQPAVTQPGPDRNLTTDEVRELQTLLRMQGFDAGAPDGVVGPRTLAAAQAFAHARGFESHDGPSLRLLQAAREARQSPSGRVG
jgi:hypothetical protein